jgi:hypothetical protein
LVDAGPRTGDFIRQPETIVDEYYEALGYDADGVPRPQTLSRLGLDPSQAGKTGVPRIQAKL